VSESFSSVHSHRNSREVADFKVSVQRAAPVLRINSATTRINDIAQIIEVGRELS
jgi:hypothetical protein